MQIEAGAIGMLVRASVEPPSLVLLSGGVTMFRVPAIARGVSAHRARRLLRGIVMLSLIGSIVAGCTRYELESKAAAYNEAVGGAANEAILLNAVRASQRAPMSFTSLGQVLAQPSFSGAATSTVNFDRLGLTTYSITPSANVNGGFQSFTMDNLNTKEFMTGLRKQISPELIRYFRELKWPEELIEVLLVASISMKPEVQARIQRDAQAICANPPDDRAARICAAIAQSAAEFAAANCYERHDAGFVYNTARNICGMAKFQIFVRQARLLRIRLFDQKLFTITPHTALGVLYYLGELIAAQNYSDRSYFPTVLIGTSEGDRLVPFFVVQRGAALPGQAAVQVHYNGESFFIPKPDLGAVDEARSLQVLDFVSQVISVQTQDKNIPKISAISIVR